MKKHLKVADQCKRASELITQTIDHLNKSIRTQMDYGAYRSETAYAKGIADTFSALGFVDEASLIRGVLSGTIFTWAGSRTQKVGTATGGDDPPPCG